MNGRPPAKGPNGWALLFAVLVVGVLLVGTAPGQALVAQAKAGKGTPRLGARELLTSERVRLSRNARDDLRSGRVDGCLVSLLVGLSKRHSFTVGVLKTGHSTYVAGTRRVSNHYRWQGADIGVVDGRPVRAGNGRARDAAVWLLRVRGSCRPSEVGSPWDLDSVGRASFTNRAHRDHLHIGV